MSTHSICVYRVISNISVVTLKKVSYFRLFYQSSSPLLTTYLKEIVLDRQLIDCVGV